MNATTLSFLKVHVEGGSVRNFDDFLFVIIAALLADVMREHQCAAMAALDEVHRTHLPVCSPAVSSRT